MELDSAGAIGKKKKATINDVAQLAGVAPSTVSHVLNGTATITDETSRRVTEAVERLNYSPNAMARALRQAKTGLIGVVLQDISSEFYAKCAASILEAAREDDFFVVVCDAIFDNAIIEDGVRALIERRVEGFIFIGGGDDEAILQFIRAAGIPVVLGDRSFKDFPSVEFDNLTTVKNLVCALYESGYRRFAYVGEPVSVQHNLALRYEGFAEGIKACNIPKRNSRIIFDESLHLTKTSTAYALFNKYFSKLPEDGLPEVVLTSNDMIAHGLIGAAKSANISVPEQLAVVGFDDISVSRYFEPALTTVWQDEKQLGRVCYQLLKSVIDRSRRTAHDVLPQQIVARKSAIIPKEVLERYTN